MVSQLPTFPFTSYHYTSALCCGAINTDWRLICLTDSSQVDFRNPAAFHRDIASVTTLLKHFLRDLPDPLLTSANYGSFLSAAQIEDDVVRRDSLHAIINELPDPNYATLRQLMLHLNKVAEHSSRNRMTPTNLATCFGPTLMGPITAMGPMSAEMRDANLQVKAVETILLNTFQIFDDDEEAS
jgi:Rho GTPase-activating protein RGD1